MKIAVCLALALPLVAADPLLRIPPARVSLEIAGQPVAIGASGTVWNGTRPGLYALSLAVDLGDLQTHTRDILKAHLDRSEPCGERIALLDAALAPAPPIAVLNARLHLERWACAKVLGKTVNKRLVAGDGTVAVTLTPVLDGPGQARLEAATRDIQADGTLGELLRSGSLGATLREKIRTSVQAALDKATDFRATLPPAVQDVVRIRALRFTDAGEGRLTLAIDAEAELSGARLEQLRAEAAARRR